MTTPNKTAICEMLREALGSPSLHIEVMPSSAPFRANGASLRRCEKIVRHGVAAPHQHTFDCPPLKIRPAVAVRSPRMDKAQRDRLSRDAVRALRNAEQMRARCAELLADDAARRVRLQKKREGPARRRASSGSDAS